MMRRMMLGFLFVLGLLLAATPAFADPHVGFFVGKYDGSLLRPAVFGTLHQPIIRYKRLGLGLGAGAGIVVDNDDPRRLGKNHMHPAVTAFIPLDIRLGGTESNWFATFGAGVGWTLPRKSRVQGHAGDFSYLMGGLTRTF